MRDFRDAKAMARTLRAALAAQGIEISISRSLELIAELFGVADWNTLAAAIRQRPPVPGENQSLPPPPPVFHAEVLFSRALEVALHRALAYANERHHEHATLEHLLLGLTDEADAVNAMKACQVDLGALKAHLTGYIDNDLKPLVKDDERDSQPTAAFQRVVQRAVRSVVTLGDRIVTGADILIAMFDETESPAVWILGEHGMDRYDAVNLTRHGTSDIFSRTRPVEVEKIQRRPTGRSGKSPR